MTTARDLVARHVFDGMTIAVGGFGLCGNPFDLIDAVRDSGVTDLTIVSNNMGTDGKGLGVLLEAQQVRKVVASYVGENRQFAQQYLDGHLEIEFTPQGTLAERLRAGGAGIPAFYTPTGAHTTVADGKPTMEIGGRTVILEHAIVADLSLVRAHQADAAGNLIYRRTARNFNPVVATAGRVTLAEVDRVVEDFLDPDLVQTPGIYVEEVIVASGRAPEIEQRTTRPRRADGGADADA
ncbi:CoA transferase subunit A [Saccharopolyspora sp. ASAGF58]|uniref:CoA transferase subunit A n=1 Tax=Saccharopolyspora sp. ASAGF58 TaxID=2719023 RepID=UPI00143FBC08|nr:CoA transferase subunit A [Saccharopolyspora sp. ASAGF58]QIZ37071.1 CoA transferase subunit A [Saccharopolyspora sp. ASAGF58]